MSTIELTTENFSETVNSDKIVLVDFWATWCGPCRQFGPIFESVSEKHPDIVFGKVDTEAQGQLAQAAGITSIPTIMGFRGGILVYQQAGALREDQLETVISSIRELDMDKVRAEIAAAEGSAEKK